MRGKHKNRENEIFEGYVELVQTMLTNIYDRIRIKDSWRSKKLSQRMIDRKLKDLDELGAWLHTKECMTWFNVLNWCIGNNRKRMHEIFVKTHAESVKFMKKHTTPCG